MSTTQLLIRFYEVVDGGGGVTYSFPAEGERTVKVGVGAECEIRIRDSPLPEVQAVFTWMKIGTEWHLMLEDLRSASGTFVNSSRVDSAWINHGDRVQIGSTTLIVRIETDEGPPGDDDPSSPAGALPVHHGRRIA
jgi:pSer/pThr/pTyr-binding forkhead associated (FHA) protein